MPAPTGAAPHAYQPTDRTVPTRARHRACYDRDLVHAILDEGYLCHLGFVREGAPVVLPTLYARVGEVLYLHGSTGSRPVRLASAAEDAADAAEAAGATPVVPAEASAANTASDGASSDRASSDRDSSDRASSDRASSDAGDGQSAGLPVCVTVTHVDGLVLARSAFHHSVNYRCVVAHGIARPVTDPAERTAALAALVDQVVPGRAADSRPGNAKELAATGVLRLDLREVSAKVRTGGPNEEPDDLDLPYWSGVLPVAVSYGTPLPADDLDPGIRVPDYLVRPRPGTGPRTAGPAC